MLKVALLFWFGFFCYPAGRQTGPKTFTEYIWTNVILIMVGKFNLTSEKCLAWRRAFSLCYSQKKKTCTTMQLLSLVWRLWPDFSLKSEGCWKYSENIMTWIYCAYLEASCWLFSAPWIPWILSLDHEFARGVTLDFISIIFLIIDSELNAWGMLFKEG